MLRPANLAYLDFSRTSLPRVIIFFTIMVIVGFCFIYVEWQAELLRCWRIKIDFLNYKNRPGQLYQADYKARVKLRLARQQSLWKLLLTVF